MQRDRARRPEHASTARHEAHSTHSTERAPAGRSAHSCLASRAGPSMAPAPLPPYQGRQPLNHCVSCRIAALRTELEQQANDGTEHAHWRSKPLRAQRRATTCCLGCHLSYSSSGTLPQPALLRHQQHTRPHTRCPMPPALQSSGTAVLRGMSQRAHVQQAVETTRVFGYTTPPTTPTACSQHPAMHVRQGGMRYARGGFCMADADATC